MIEVACVAGQKEVACRAEHGVHGRAQAAGRAKLGRVDKGCTAGGVSCKMPRPECVYSEPASGNARMPAAMRSAALMAN
eukprot:7782896-Lingulodinium_polyedra.AAC.1